MYDSPKFLPLSVTPRFRAENHAAVNFPFNLNIEAVWAKHTPTNSPTAALPRCGSPGLAGEIADGQGGGEAAVTQLPRRAGQPHRLFEASEHPVYDGPGS